MTFPASHCSVVWSITGFRQTGSVRFLEDSLIQIWSIFFFIQILNVQRTVTGCNVPLTTAVCVQLNSPHLEHLFHFALISPLWVLTLPSWPVCGCGWRSCHRRMNPHSLMCKVPPALRSLRATDASWEVPVQVLGPNMQRQGPLHTNTGDMGVHVREGELLYQQVCGTHTRTHPL